MANRPAAPLEYGMRRRPHRAAWTVLALMLSGVTVVALVGLWATTRATRIAVARAWTVTGPPCATARVSDLAQAGVTPTQAEIFADVSFVRTHGAIRCAEVGYDGGRSDKDFPVCQFDHPGAVAVTTSRGTYQFTVPPLKAAAIEVRHGLPTCVVTGFIPHFNIRAGRTGWSAATTIGGDSNLP
jgi:hypothetical protein